MGKVELDWVNEGEPTEVGKLPIAGRKSIARVKKEATRVVTIQTNGLVNHLRAVLLTVRKILDQDGVGKARKAWMASYGGVYDELAWGKKEFEAELDTLIERVVYKSLEVDNWDDAVKAVEEKSAEVNEAMGTITDEYRDFKDRMAVEEVLWYLWKAKPRPSWMPSLSDLPDTEEELEEYTAHARAHIENNLDDADHQAILTAVHGDDLKEKNLDIGDIMENLDEEVVAKKSSST